MKWVSTSEALPEKDAAYAVIVFGTLHIITFRKTPEDAARTGHWIGALDKGGSYWCELPEVPEDSGYQFRL